MFLMLASMNENYLRHVSAGQVFLVLNGSEGVLKHVQVFQYSFRVHEILAMTQE